MSKKIAIHKRVNQNVVVGDSEAVAVVFYSLMGVYNKQDTYEDIKISKQSLWELSGFSGKYNSVKLYDLLKKLGQGKSFDISSIFPESDIKEISGSMFVIQERISTGNIEIHVPTPYRKLLFYKKDIDLMTKAKRKEPMSVGELDYYDKEVKPKSKFLVLLNQADILGINGKYNKRLYALLKQWDYVGKYMCNWDEFKNILMIPKSYITGMIDQRILNVAKVELLKFGIEITNIDKIKNGRKIDKIVISFKTIGADSSNKDTKVKKKPLKMEMTEQEIAKQKELNKKLLKQMTIK